MRRTVEKLLGQYGIQVQFSNQTVRALLQPVTGRLERLALREPGPVGLESVKRYVYIGPVDPAPKEDEVLEAAGKCYLARTVHLIEGNDGPAYCWAMCVERGGTDLWGVS